MWDLAEDVVPDLHERGRGNPHSDRFGNSERWYFYGLPRGVREGWAAEKIASESELGAFRQHAGGLKAELRQTVATLEELGYRQEAMGRQGAYEAVYGVVEGESADARVQRRGDPSVTGAGRPTKAGTEGADPHYPKDKAHHATRPSVMAYKLGTPNRKYGAHHDRKHVSQQ